MSLRIWSDRWRDKFNNDLYIRRLSCLISFNMHFVFCLKKITITVYSLWAQVSRIRALRRHPVQTRPTCPDRMTKHLWKMEVNASLFQHVLLWSSACPFLINDNHFYQKSSSSVPPRWLLINSPFLNNTIWEINWNQPDIFWNSMIFYSFGFDWSPWKNESEIF